MAGCGRGVYGGRGRGRRQWASDDGWGSWGGYMQAKKQKLEQQDLSTVNDSNIFKGISVFVNGYTDPSCDEIKRLITSNGGIYHHYYSRTKVTHIIASNLPTSKKNQIRDEKVVKPDWIVDSVKATKLLPYQRYLLYKPEASRQNVLFHSKHPSECNVTLCAGSAPGTSICTSETFTSTKSLGAGLDNRKVVDSSDVASLTESSSSTVLQGVAASCDTVTSCSSVLTDEVLSVPISPSSDDVGDNSNDLPFDVDETVQEQINFDSTVELASIDTRVKTIADCLTTSEEMSAENRKRVAEFYSHSRLHYISTWCSDAKAHVAQLQTEEKPNMPGREKLRNLVNERNSGSDDDAPVYKVNDKDGLFSKLSKTVMHIDMDCFFVSVGLQSRPHLRGKPIAVTHSRGKGPSHDSLQSREQEEDWRRRHEAETADDYGAAAKITNPNFQQIKEASNTDDVFSSMAEIASCSYEARRAGVKNGMLFGRAKQLCPDLIPIPYDFEGYQRVSRILYNTVAGYTRDIEAVSCDELFIDCVDLLADTGASCLEFATLLRQDIYEQTGCTASTGIGANMLQAKMATNVAKPNGQFMLKPEDVYSFMQDKQVSDLPGVGYSLKAKLEALGVTTCGDLQKQPLQLLQKKFGLKTGQSLFNHCRGIDKRSFQTGVLRKSVSAEMNYGIRFTKISEVDNFLGQLASEVHSRLAKLNMKCKSVTLKLMIRHPDAPKETSKFMGHGICDVSCKSSRLPVATDSVNVIAAECRSLLQKFALDPSDLRGVGIHLTGLEPLQPCPPSSTSSAATVGCRSILEFAKAKPSSSGPSAVLLPDSAKNALATKTDNSKPLGITSFTKEGLLRTLTDVDTGARAVLSESPSADCSWCLPSSSQIDLEVLQALPPDIRDSIERALRMEERRHQSDRADGRSSSESDIPGCSFWTESASHFDPALPSFSQLDAEIMEALPIDIREEIKSAYLPGNPGLKFSSDSSKVPLQSIKTEVNESPTNAETLPLSPKKGSPTKPITSAKNSPKKGDGSPFKTPIGHPPRRRKYNTRKKFQSVAKQKQLVNCAVKLDDAFKPTPVAAVASFDDQSADVFVDKSANFASSARSEPSAARSEPINDIKSTLREWFATCDGPAKEELEGFVSYLVQLVHSCDLETVCLLLKFVQRLIRQETLQVAWKKGGQWIIDQTQAAVRSAYGGSLKLNS